MRIKPPVCEFCIHYHGNAHCDAFDERIIPDKIFSGKESHTEPVPGDHDIRFEPDPKYTKEEIATILSFYK